MRNEVDLKGSEVDNMEKLKETMSSKIKTHPLKVISIGEINEY